jgi:competence protein ComFC
VKYHSWAYRILQVFWAGMDLIFPPDCGGCGEPASRWCMRCQSAVRIISPPVCHKCGLPLKRPGLCSACRAIDPDYDTLRAWAVFDFPVKQALHRLKYRRDLELGEALTRQMSSAFEKMNWRVDMVVPIPLGKQRLKERGYNQAAIIALPLALRFGYDYQPRALRRLRDTLSQVGLNAIERRENVRNAFQANSSVRGKHILLVDDVSTTGATLSSAAEAVYAAEAQTVKAFTVARALPSGKFSMCRM